jgi:cobalamin biosynthesis Mg chelatase CobN
VATEQHDIMSAVNDDHIVSNAATNLSDQSVENDSTVTTIVNELLSAPDSTGKQHATQRTTTTQKQYRNRKNDVKSGSNTNIDKTNKSNINKKGDSKTDAKITAAQTDETKVTTPIWLKTLVVVLGIVLLVGIYLVLRRFGVIEWVVGVFGRFRDKIRN